MSSMPCRMEVSYEEKEEDCSKRPPPTKESYSVRQRDDVVWGEGTSFDDYYLQ